jgi:hypothetical protein
MIDPHSLHIGASATAAAENGSACCGSGSVGRTVGFSSASFTHRAELSFTSGAPSVLLAKLLQANEKARALI